jgi:hypothetical protein
LDKYDLEKNIMIVRCILILIEKRI